MFDKLVLPQPLLYLSYYGMQFFEISSFVAGNLLDVIVLGNWIIAPSAVGGYLGVFGNVLLEQGYQGFRGVVFDETYVGPFYLVVLSEFHGDRCFFFLVS